MWARWTAREEGDIAPPVAGDVAGEEDWLQRTRAVLPRRWSWLRQVHGTDVVVVAGPGHRAGETGDALVSRDRRTCLAVFTADCASLALASPEGVMGAVHAGWRGLRDGVVDKALAAMGGLGASRVVAALGPCIHACCCEFSPADLAEMSRRLGPGVRSVTRCGRPALDVPAAVGSALERASERSGVAVELGPVDGRCTVCTPGFFSHRARRDRGRQALLVWWG